MKDTLFVFDIDGTLIDSAQSYALVLIEAFKHMGIVEIDTEFDNYLHHTDSYALQYNFEKNFDEPFNHDLFTVLDEALGKEIRQHPAVVEVNGAKNFIETLRDSNTAFAFATGAFPIPTRYKMTQAEIWYDESLLVTSIHHMTRETMVADAIEKAKTYFQLQSPKRIISVGDGLWDLETANNLNIEFVGIGNRNKDVLLDNGCKTWFEDIEQLHAYFN